MATAPLTIDAGDAAKRLTLTVKVAGMRKFRARVWIGTQFIKLGGWIVGFGTIRVS